MLSTDRKLMLQTAWLISIGCAACVTLGLALVGCSRERPSEIVRMVEKAGARDLRRASVHAITHWFYKHLYVATQAAKRCRVTRARASAEWPETTEGRVCTAA